MKKILWLCLLFIGQYVNAQVIPQERDSVKVARDSVIIAQDSIIIVRDSVMPVKDSLIAVRASTVLINDALTNMRDSLIVAKDAVEDARRSLIKAQAELAAARDSLANRKGSRIDKNSPWIQKNTAGVDISEVTFVNWNAGGSNSISALFGVNSSLNYKYENFYWGNKGKIRYGVNKQESQHLRKTEDIIELDSNVGYRRDSLTNWFFSAHFNFKTQFTNGYNYPNREKAISKFMAPGYMFIGGGAEYGKDMEEFSFYFSPLTVKTTYVLDRRLSDQGAFGVAAAEYDINGNLLKHGRQTKTEVGILINNYFESQVFENIKISSKLSLYTDYINSFGNVDVDWFVNFDFKVNQWVKASLGSHLRYDDDIKLLTPSDVAGEYVENGAKVQWKQILGIGVAIDF